MIRSLVLDGSNDPEQLAIAAGVLRRGGVVAVPTESSYGLAADAFDPIALARLAAIKGRSASKPPPILIGDRDQLEQLVALFPEAAGALADRFWPGPLTLVVPARPDLPPAIVEAGFVGVRVSSHPIATALARSFGGPITATSANLAGQPPALTADHAALPGVDLVLDAGPAPGGPPSTVARIHPDGRIELLRAGPIAV